MQTIFDAIAMIFGLIQGILGAVNEITAKKDAETNEIIDSVGGLILDAADIILK